MAAVSTRQILRLRPHFLSNHLSLPFSRYALSSYSSSNSNSDSRLTSLYRRTLYLLETCHRTKQLEHIQTHLITSGILQNPFVAGSVLKYAADLGEINFTLLVFRCILAPDTFCINTVIKAYACSSIPNQAMVFYFEMLRDGFIPNSFTFPPLISSCGKIGSLKPGEKFHGQAVKNGVDCVLPVGNSLIHLYACCGVIDLSQRMFDGMPLRDLVSWNSIVDAYAKVGELTVAHTMFDLMPEKNVVSYNVMITGYLNGGNPGCCLKLFREMANKPMKGNDMTVASLLTACGRSARLREGRSLHCSIIKGLINPNLIINTALIDMYSKCKRVDVARLVFDRILTKNLVCWNAMILGHCIHGNPRDGLSLLELMVSHNEMKLDEEKGLRPDEVTFIGVLCACARLGYLTEGRNYLKQMVELYGLRPNFAHHWCMANLFSSAGLVQEAMEILKEIPVNEDVLSESLLWARLLGSCRFEGTVILGEQIAKSLIELEPKNALYYRLLLNVYAVAGRWGDVAQTKRMMKGRGFDRMMGCSLLDLNDFICNFNVGDNWQQCLQELSATMAESALRLSSLSTNYHRLPLQKPERGS